MHSFVLGVLWKRSVITARNSITITYPFHPVQIIVRTDMVFCLPTILYYVLPREGNFTSMASEELPKLLTFVIRYNCLHLIEEMTCESEFDITVEGTITCLISEATILSTV